MYTITRKQLVLDLYSAFYCAKKNKAKKQYVKDFEVNLDKNIEILADDLLNRNYSPLPSSCFIINYPKKREVFAAQFRDRIVHHLYFNYTHKMFERTFIQDSYSCIENRGTHYGIDRLKKHILQESRNYTRKCYILKLDKRGYFMHINRNILLKIASESISKMAKHYLCKGSKQKWEDVMDIGFVLWLTKVIITLDPKNNCVIACNKKEWIGLDTKKSLFNAPDGCGLPIGNLTSQLFSNVYLNVFDQFMKRVLKCKHYGRYVDDSYVVSSDKKWLLSIIDKVKAFLMDVLGLELNMGKIILSEACHGVEFIGAFIKPFRTYISNNALKRMVDKVNSMNLSDSEGVWRSVNSCLGILSHYSSFNIRCGLFMKACFLNISSFDRNMTKML